LLPLQPCVRLVSRVGLISRVWAYQPCFRLVKDATSNGFEGTAAKGPYGLAGVGWPSQGMRWTSGMAAVFAGYVPLTKSGRSLSTRVTAFRLTACAPHRQDSRRAGPCLQGFAPHRKAVLPCSFPLLIRRIQTSGYDPGDVLPQRGFPSRSGQGPGPGIPR